MRHARFKTKSAKSGMTNATLATVDDVLDCFGPVQRACGNKLSILYEPPSLPPNGMPPRVDDKASPLMCLEYDDIDRFTVFPVSIRSTESIDTIGAGHQKVTAP